MLTWSESKCENNTSLQLKGAIYCKKRWKKIKENSDFPSVYFDWVNKNLESFYQDFLTLNESQRENTISLKFKSAIHIENGGKDLRKFDFHVLFHSVWKPRVMGPHRLQGFYSRQLSDGKDQIK